MELADGIFRRKSYDTDKLIAYGFQKHDDGFFCTFPVMDARFALTVNVHGGKIKTDVTDLAAGEAFPLYHVAAANGAFVGKLRAEAEQILRDIAEKCFYDDVFKTRQAKELIAFVQDTFGDELEFLWQRFPDNAIWRRPDSKTWYGALLTVSRRKLGQDSDETVEILDLRYPKEKMDELVDHRRFFPGWHMNKKSWFAIILDESVDTKEICRLITYSRQLAKP